MVVVVVVVVSFNTPINIDQEKFVSSPKFVSPPPYPIAEEVHHAEPSPPP